MTDSEIISALAAWGCDTEGALNRTLCDASFLVECMRIFCEDRHFDQMGDAIARRDAQAAFECAHAIKGVAGNLGLTPLYRVVSDVVEPLREGSLVGAEAGYAEVVTQYRRFLDCMGK